MSLSPIAWPIYTREKFLDQVDDDEALMARLIALFQSNTPRLLDDLRDAIARRHAEDLARVAHALLSSLGAIGAERAYRLVLRLEELGRGGDFTGVEETLAETEAAMAAVFAAIQELSCARA